MNNKMKKISKPLLLIVALCMWGGCKDDSLQGDGENGLTTVGTNYMAFNIVSDGGVSTRGTRAWPDGTPDLGEFDAGSDEEQAVTTAQGSNVAIFFNEDDSFHSMRDLSRVLNTDGGTPHDRYENDTEVSVGTFVANLKLEEGTSAPTKVLVVLNGNPDRLDNLENLLINESGDEYKLSDESTPKNNAEFVLGYLTRRLDDATINNENATVVLFSPSGIDEEYCTMTNSVYVGNGNTAEDIKLGADYQKGAIYNLARIEEKNIQPTEDLAKQADNLLTIHVERLAVKVEVDIDSKMNPDPLGTGSKNPYTVKDFEYPILLSPTGDGAEGNVLKMPAGGTEVTEAQPVPWAFAMLGWSTNAVARRMYLFKNLNDFRADLNKKTDISPHHDGDNSITKPFFSYWNDAPRARCYWAVDGHYADPDAYPVQYRDAKDNTGTNSYKDMTSSDKTETMPLYYYSFTQMRMICQGLVPKTDPAGITAENYGDYLQKGNLRHNLRYRYCGENVLGQRLIKDANRIWRGASTHVVFFGQLLLGDEIKTYKTTCEEQGNQLTQDLMNSVSDKLLAGGCYWNRADYMQNAYTNIFRALTTSDRTITDRFGSVDGKGKIETPKNNIKLYYQKGTGEKTELTSTYFTDLMANGETKTKLNGVHDNFDYTKDDCNGDDETDTDCIFRLSAANVSNGDGRVMLGLKKDCKLFIEGYDEGSADLKTVEINPGQFLSIAYEFAGVADLYAHGRMYYYAPIYHAAAGKAATGAAPEKVGDIGVVRNHWYKLTISSLLKPGIPVSDPGQPIIPNIDPTDRYLGLEIHVLPWHVIGQQVTLQ